MDYERMNKMEARIEQLEKEVEQLKSEKKNEQITHDEEVYQPTATNVKQPITDNSHIPEPVQRKKKEETDWETLIGKVWLPRIFIFVLLLGLVWGFRIAVDAGWLNETTRVAIGFIVAALFYYIGNEQIKKDRIALGKVLLVGFISTLFVTTFAMHILYSMIPVGLAFPLNVAWVAIGIYLAHRHHSQAMGVMFAVAGYLIPFLVGGSSTSSTVLTVITYELIYYIALLWFAVHNQFRILFYVSTIFLHIVYAALSFNLPYFWDGFHLFIMAIGIIIQHESIFITFLKGKSEKIKAFPVLFSSFVVTLVWAKIGFEVYDLSYLFTIYVIATTLRYGWVTYHAKMKENINLLSISSVIATFGIAVLIVELVNNQYVIASLYLIHGTLAVYVGYKFQSKIQNYVGYFIYYWIVLIIIADSYIYRWEDIVVWAILVGTLYALILFSLKRKDETLFQVNIGAFLLIHVLFLIKHEYDGAAIGPIYWIAVIISLYTLYQLAKEQMNTIIKQIYFVVNVVIHLGFISYLANEFISTSTNTAILLTTTGWALYALGCVFIGVKNQHKQLRMSGIVLILLTLSKLLLFDLAFISLTTRAVLFVFIGLIGIAVSRFIYGKSK